MLSTYRTLSQGTIKENALGYIKQTKWVVSKRQLFSLKLFSLILSLYLFLILFTTEPLRNPEKLGKHAYA